LLPSSSTKTFPISPESKSDNNKPNNNSQQTLEDNVATATPEPSPTPKVTATPAPTTTPEPNNSYDYAKSKGLDADYLKDLNFDDHAIVFIDYLISLPSNMIKIASDSGLIGKVLVEEDGSKNVSAEEVEYFSRVLESYGKEIDTWSRWLNEIPEDTRISALATNLENLLEIERRGESYSSLRSENLPPYLNRGLFQVNTEQRKYVSEILYPDDDNLARTAVTSPEAALENMTQNFWGAHDRAWEIAIHPDYLWEISDNLITTERRLESWIEGNFPYNFSSSEFAEQAKADIKTLLAEGSPIVKAGLRIYANNTTGWGSRSRAEQSRVELTMVDLHSIGLYSEERQSGNHDEIMIPITPKDIDLLKGLSNKNPLIYYSENGQPVISVLWTREGSSNYALEKR